MFNASNHNDIRKEVLEEKSKRRKLARRGIKNINSFKAPKIEIDFRFNLLLGLVSQAESQYQGNV
jgi:hypothetical protein